MNNSQQKQKQQQNLSPNLLKNAHQEYAPLIKLLTIGIVGLQALFIFVIAINLVMNLLLSNEHQNLERYVSAISQKSTIVVKTTSLENKINILKSEMPQRRTYAAAIHDIESSTTQGIQYSSIRFRANFADIEFTSENGLQAALLMSSLLENESVDNIVLNSASLGEESFLVTIKVAFK